MCGLTPLMIKALSTATNCTMTAKSSNKVVRDSWFMAGRTNLPYSFHKKIQESVLSFPGSHHLMGVEVTVALMGAQMALIVCSTHDVRRRQGE